jgi:hypothetical protein
METYGGIPADSISLRAFWEFIREHWRELLRYLRWAARMKGFE